MLNIMNFAAAMKKANPVRDSPFDYVDLLRQTKCISRS